MTFKKYTSLLVVLIIIIYLYFEGSYLPHFCLFEKLLDLKCSFCDITSSYEEIINFNFFNAFKINFMSYVLIIYLLLNTLLNHFNLFKFIIKIDKIFFGLCIIQFFILNI